MHWNVCLLVSPNNILAVTWDSPPLRNFDLATRNWDTGSTSFSDLYHYNWNFSNKNSCKPRIIEDCWQVVALDTVVTWWQRTWCSAEITATFARGTSYCLVCWSPGRKTHAYALTTKHCILQVSRGESEAHVGNVRSRRHDARSLQGPCQGLPALHAFFGNRPLKCQLSMQLSVPPHVPCHHVPCYIWWLDAAHYCCFLPKDSWWSLKIMRP